MTTNHCPESIKRDILALLIELDNRHFGELLVSYQQVKKCLEEWGLTDIAKTLEQGRLRNAITKLRKDVLNGPFATRIQALLSMEPRIFQDSDNNGRTTIYFVWNDNEEEVARVRKGRLCSAIAPQLCQPAEYYKLWAKAWEVVAGLITEK